jgi:hypothetical protein
MDEIIKYINANSGFFSAILSFVLIVITSYYAVITHILMQTTKQQISLSYNPVVGINVNEINISKVFGPNRRNLDVNLEISNIGNAPAIDIKIDSEIHFRYSNINVIPSRFDPEYIPFLNNSEKKIIDMHYGNKAIKNFFDDVRESFRLNIHRIETDPSKESYPCSTLVIYVYYRNSLNQYYISTYNIEIDLITSINENPIPAEDKSIKVDIINYRSSKYTSKLYELKKINEEIESRDKMRSLSGW